MRYILQYSGEIWQLIALYQGIRLPAFLTQEISGGSLCPASSDELLKLNDQETEQGDCNDRYPPFDREWRRSKRADSEQRRRIDDYQLESQGGAAADEHHPVGDGAEGEC